MIAAMSAIPQKVFIIDALIGLIQAQELLLSSSSA
jgi:hypothetical protein